MAAAQAAAVAQDGAIDGFTQGGADGATGNAAAQAAQDRASDGTEGRHRRNGLGAEAHAEVCAGNGARERGGHATGCTGQRADGGAGLFAELAGG